MMDPFAAIQNSSDLAKLGRVPKYSVWQYTLNILSGGTTLGTYHVQIGGAYSSSSTSTYGGGSGRPKL